MGGPQGPFRSARWSDRTWLLVRLLLAGAVDYARERRVRMLEAYPVDKLERSHDDFMFFGSRSLYEKAGFREVVRRSPTRLIMRRRTAPTTRDVAALLRCPSSVSCRESLPSVQRIPHRSGSRRLKLRKFLKLRDRVLLRRCRGCLLLRVALLG